MSWLNPKIDLEPLKRGATVREHRIALPTETLGKPAPKAQVRLYPSRGGDGARRVMIGGKKYPSLRHARRALGCSVRRIYRLIGEDWRL